MSELIDITGQTFGELKALSYAGNKFWNCQCSCGKLCKVLGRNLRKGIVKSCGEHIHGDLTGQRFGKLVAIERIAERKRECVQYRCICDCGKEFIALATNLRNGLVKSCGCSRFEHLHKLAKQRVKHGKTNSRLYHVWNNIKARCYDKHNNRYRYYGERGIIMCDEWRNDYQAFYDWAMANGYNPDAPRGQCTIDRIDIDGNYEPSNCRWVDSVVQANNMSKNLRYTIDGVTHTLAEWARLYDLDYFFVRGRLKAGWSIEEALIIPNQRNHQKQTLI